MLKENIKLLLIEDNPGDTRLIQEMLMENKDVNFDIKLAEKLADALIILNNNEIDIILTDLGLPDSKGLDTFKKLHEKAPEIPILILTVINDDGMGLQTVQEGAQDFLVKGQVDSELLVRSIRYAIERKRSEEIIRISEHKLRSFMNSAADSFTLWDANLNLIDINRTSFGFHSVENNKAELIGKNITEIVPTSKEPDVFEKYLEVLKTGKPYFTDDVIYHPKYGEIHFVIRVFKVDDGLGMQVTDITERKRAEEILMKKTQRLERFVKLAVGREKKMKELKKKIKTLEEPNKSNINRLGGN